MPSHCLELVLNLLSSLWKCWLVAKDASSWWKVSHPFWHASSSSSDVLCLWDCLGFLLIFVPKIHLYLHKYSSQKSFGPFYFQLRFHICLNKQKSFFHWSIPFSSALLLDLHVILFICRFLLISFEMVNKIDVFGDVWIWLDVLRHAVGF